MNTNTENWENWTQDELSSVRKTPMNLYLNVYPIRHTFTLEIWCNTNRIAHCSNLPTREKAQELCDVLADQILLT